MEALRAIHRLKHRNRCPKTSAKTCEIVDYVERNFECDGDVEAQVRTALKRTCCQGYVKKLGSDAYRLVGPLACQLGKTQISNSRQPSPKSDTRRCDSRCPSRSPPRCNRDSGDANRSQESSEIDLSIPSSTEADIIRNRIERDIERLEPPDNSSRAGADATMKFGFAQRARNPRLEQSGQRCGHGDGNQSAGMPIGHSTPARHSETRESDAVVGGVANPALKIGVHLPDFEDDDGDDDDETIVAPDEQSTLDDDDDEGEEDGDDPASDESVLRSIRCDESGSSCDDARDLELKRWIRSCRKECLKRARETAARAELNQQ